MKIKSLLVLILLGYSLLSIAESYRVSNIQEYNQQLKKVQPGDSLVLSNGVWKDVHFKFRATGEVGKYISMVAETPGQVFIEGQSRLQLSGEYLMVSGLVFRNGYTPKSNVIEFRTSSQDYAYQSVVSNCVIDDFSQLSKDSADHWVGLYGKNNRVEYCYFGGKKNQGVTLIVWPNDSNSIENNHRIYRNYFGPRPRLGSNGGETIRIGTSHVCHMNSNSIVEGNFFERCNGEVEIVSNKSGGNQFLNNTFFESEGSLVLRHGDNAIVSGNWFIGNGKPFTGGVRIINEGHMVYNNYFYKLRGEDFRAPLVVMNAIPNSPANGYAAVRNVVIAHNTYVDCTLPWSFGVGAGTRDRTVIPENTLVMNNLVYSPQESELIKAFDKTDGIKFDNNLLISKSGYLTGEGTAEGNITQESAWGVDYVTTNAVGRKLGFIRADILGRSRSVTQVGAFQQEAGDATIPMAGPQNTGPSWYVPQHLKVVQSTSKELVVEPGIDVLTRIVAKASAGDVIVLQAGVHVITRKVLLNKNLTFRAASNAKTKPVIRMDAQRDNAFMFEIEGNAHVVFDGVAMDGNSKSANPTKYAIVTSKTQAIGYNIIINNCEIYDFKVETGAAINAYKGTIADTIRIENSILRDLNRAMILSQEKEDVGKYSAEQVQLVNTVFKNIRQYVLDYYRGGTDESTLGGNLFVDHCVFDMVGQEEKSFVLRTNGIVFVTIQNSVFYRSLAKIPVRLVGNKQQLLHCNFWECAEPKLDKTAISKGNMNENPRFAKKSYQLSNKSKLKGKATNGSDIGLL